jgi:hypothetical protein
MHNDAECFGGLLSNAKGGVASAEPRACYRLARVADPRLVALFGVAFALAGCGSRRLETAAEPVEAGASSQGGSAGESPPSSGSTSAGGAPAPLESEELVGLDDFAATYMVGPISADRFAVQGQPFSEAWRATMAEPPSSPWIAQLVVPVDEAVMAGQLLRVSFWLSCEAPGETGGCYTECIFERASDPWEKSVTFVADAAGAWEQKSEYFSVVDSYAAGQAQLVFRLGYAAQVIDIGGLVVERIGAAP